MATFLDISILGHFTSIFTFLLVFVIVYGMLSIFKIFGEEKQSLNAIIALCLGFLVLFSSGVVRVIQTFTPWFTILILIIFFVLFLIRMFGVEGKEISEGFFDTPMTTWIIIFTVIILLFSLGQGFGQTTLETGQGINTTSTTINNGTVAQPGATNTNNFSQNLYNTIYHPKVLGMILILLIAIIAMLLITSREGPNP